MNKFKWFSFAFLFHDARLIILFLLLQLLVCLCATHTHTRHTRSIKQKKIHTATSCVAKIHNLYFFCRFENVWRMCKILQFVFFSHLSIFILQFFSTMMMTARLCWTKIRTIFPHWRIFGSEHSLVIRKLWFLHDL